MKKGFRLGTDTCKRKKILCRWGFQPVCGRPTSNLPFIIFLRTKQCINIKVTSADSSVLNERVRIRNNMRKLLRHKRESNKHPKESVPLEKRFSPQCSSSYSPSCHRTCKEKVIAVNCRGADHHTCRTLQNIQVISSFLKFIYSFNKNVRE